MQYQKLVLIGQKEIMETKLIRRDITIDYNDLLNLKKILVLVGPRRAGKTFMMYQIAQDLVNLNKILLKQIVYINFSAILFENFDIERLLESYFELYPDLEPVFFFDEVQEIDNFEKMVLYLYSKGFQVFLTGSNSKLLSKEISTNLRGKYIEKFVYPLSFDEFLLFKDFDSSKHFVLEEDLGKLRNLFIEYLIWGGFPEVVLAENKVTKRELISSYFHNMLYIDLIERYKIENEFVLKEMIIKILKSISKQFSVHKLFNDLKSMGYRIGKSTLYNYLVYLQNAFFIDLLLNFYKKTSKKVYLYDWGFLNLLAETDNLGQRFENFIYLCFKRWGGNLYFKSNGGEIDFYLPDLDINIQVCFYLNEANLERELKSLLKQSGKKIVIYFKKEVNKNLPDDVLFLDFWSFLKERDKFLI